MNQTYLKEHMIEELEGAKDYIQRAIEIKAMDPSWGKMFYEMSVQELAHAQNFFKMAEDYYKKVTSAYSESPKYMDDCMHEITEIYTEQYSQIKVMHEMYNR